MPTQPSHGAERGGAGAAAQVAVESEAVGRPQPRPQLRQAPLALRRGLLARILGASTRRRQRRFIGPQAGVQELQVQLRGQAHAHAACILVHRQSLGDGIRVLGQAQHGLDGKGVQRSFHGEPPVLTDSLRNLTDDQGLPSIKEAAHHSVDDGYVWWVVNPGAVQLDQLDGLRLYFANHGGSQQPAGKLAVLDLDSKVHEHVHELQAHSVIFLAPRCRKKAIEIRHAYLLVVDNAHVAELLL
mmetsp:Transcript_92887/g.206632  ORF Transcript_92887/g.206632 Transcript_92887/m.206632 type:complete len:242 (+) Transcript_92887:326-1051(+)